MISGLKFHVILWTMHTHLHHVFTGLGVPKPFSTIFKCKRAFLNKPLMERWSNLFTAILACKKSGYDMILHLLVVVLAKWGCPSNQVALGGPSLLLQNLTYFARVVLMLWLWWRLNWGTETMLLVGLPRIQFDAFVAGGPQMVFSMALLQRRHKALT